METPLPTIREGLRQLFQYLPRRRRWQALVVICLMVVSAFAELVTLGAVLPFLALIANPSATDKYPVFRSTLEAAGFVGQEEALVGVALFFIIAAVASAMIRILLTRISQKFVYRIGYDLGVALYNRMLHQPYSFHVANNTSKILSGMAKVQAVVGGLLMPILQCSTAIIIATFIFGGLLVINAQVALTAGLGFGLLYTFVSVATRSRLKANSQLISRSGTERFQTLQEGLGGIRDVLLDHAQPIYLDKYRRIDTAMRDAQATNALIGAAPRYVIESSGMILIVVLALVLSRQEGGLASALPVLGALALGAQRLLPLLQQIYKSFAAITGSRYSFADVLALLECPLPPDAGKRHRVKPLPFHHSIAVQDVSFRYSQDGAMVLRHVNISIPKGARVGFIGKTGSGKSTIMDLLMGLLTPTEGHIAVDGKLLGAANIPAWQTQIAHVPQHIYLSDGPILENIAFGLPPEQIDRERVRSAAWKADLGAFIEELPNGYDTWVGERGVRLSGGQRQRIGIARALYKESSVLVFDEATSALDDATEAAVMDSIDGLGPNLTVLMIAHRVTTLRNCDVIYRMEKGEIIQQGSYEEVVAGFSRDAPLRVARSD